MAGLRHRLLGWVCGLLALAGAAQAQSASPVPPAFERIEAVHSDWSATAPPQAGWTEVSLPDQWIARWPGHEGVVWYRLRWQQADATQPVALMIDSITMAGAVSVNGLLIAQDSHLVEPLSRSWNRPRHWLIAPPLLRPGVNELLVRVSGMAVYHGGLGAVSIGDAGTVADSYDRAEVVRRALLQIGVGVTLASMVLFGMIWLLRRSEQVYGWFALFSLLRLPYGYHYIATEIWPYPDTATFQFANLAFLLASATSFVFFALHFGQLRLPRLRSLVLGACVAAIAAVAFTPVPWLAQARNAAVVVAAAIFLAGASLLLWHAWRSRRTEAIALAVWVVLPMATAVHDLLVYLRFITTNTYYFPAVSSLMLLGMASVLALHLIGGIRMVEHFNAQLRERVDAATARLAQMLHRQHAGELERARLTERMSLVRDLHDGLGMTLSGHIHALQARGSAVDSGSLWALREINADLRLLIEGASLDDTDRFVERLAPLRHRSTRLLDAAGITCRWELHDLADCRLDARRSLDLLRLLQEALTNVLKHSGASEVKVRLEAADGQLALSVADNGHGFEAKPQESAAPGGLGLQSMRARAQRLGGELVIRTDAQGTVLALRLPLAPPEAQAPRG
ncbi:ATP-binding protein [Xenophilus arseniciresistens]|uniref:ATP-binding protein n=1 Tax=Xenophilus arseniciresistens TaxID=1283306 RepID=A0AAE3N9G4_9BURK|nr:ATP-binding protein [Xenophilus arseniciresistens]MDA7418440.1 ATP-binding protein [Xenophilus arseniciresistens]